MLAIVIPSGAARVHVRERLHVAGVLEVIQDRADGQPLLAGLPERFDDRPQLAASRPFKYLGRRRLVGWIVGSIHARELGLPVYLEDTTADPQRILADSPAPH